MIYGILILRYEKLGIWELGMMKKNREISGIKL